MQDFHFVMRLNRASPALMKACATGQHIKTATLSARKAGKGQQEYLTFKFRDVLISAFQTTGSEETPVPSDSVSFNFAKIEVEYKPEKSDGSLGGRRLPVRPEGEQDLLARHGRRRSRGARPQRPSSRAPRPAASGERAQAVELARLLRDAGYDTGRIQERLATGDELLARSPELPSYLRRLGDADELAVLLRLFLLGVPVPGLASRSSSATSSANASRRPGFSSRCGGHPRCGARRPARRAADGVRPCGRGGGHADHVPGVHRPSVALAHLTVRGDGERALDLCTGNGIQAILLAAHAEHVVATDVNERALAYARFNAALNGVDNVETRAGSFFEPVEGEQFDLVVANPPYVVSPESAYLFRDSGMRGDAVSELVVRGGRATLAPGAFASRPDRVGARPGRSGRAPTPLAGRLGLRRVPAPHVHGRPDRDRNRLESRTRRPARCLRRGARSMARVLPRARDRAARLRLPRAAQARRRP